MTAAFKKLTVAVALAGLVATGSLAAATPAAAGWGWRHDGSWVTMAADGAFPSPLVC
jgi:hypothetical protein